MFKNMFLDIYENKNYMGLNEIIRYQFVLYL